MDFISSQGSSLLSVDISSSDVTDSGLALLKDCPNLQTFAFNYTDQLSEHGLKHISGNLLCFFCATIQMLFIAKVDVPYGYGTL